MYRGNKKNLNGWEEMLKIYLKYLIGRFIVFLMVIHT